VSSPDQQTAVRAALRRLTTEVDGLDQRAADHFAVNRTDLRCLDVLRSTGPTTPTRLAAAVGMTSGGLSLALDRLESAGYVTRQRNDADRRSVLVHATAELARIEGVVFAPLGQQMVRIIARYTDEELAVIHDFLTKTAVAIAGAAPPPSTNPHDKFGGEAPVPFPHAPSGPT
jgi:DNA-binding MarR family transcriptional regulator